MEDKIIIMFHFDGKVEDIEVPLGITATELIYGLNTGFELGIDVNDPQRCFFRSENPIALIKGESTLDDLGMRNGTSIFYGC